MTHLLDKYIGGFKKYLRLMHSYKDNVPIAHIPTPTYHHYYYHHHHHHHLVVLEGAATTD